MSDFPSQEWERELVDGLIDAGNKNAKLSGDGAREKAMANLAKPIAEAIKNGGGPIHWVGSFTVNELNNLENPDFGGIYGVKDGGVIVNRDGSRIEVSANDALVWNGEKWASFIDIDLDGYAKTEEVAAVAAAIAAHSADLSNPHEVTAAQVGAYTKEQVDGFIRNWSGYIVVPYGQQKPEASEAQLGKIYLVQVSTDPEVRDQYEEWISDGTAWSLIGTMSIDLSPYDKIVDAEAREKAISDALAEHVADKTNPHGVTPEQIGAAKSTDLSGYVKKTGDTMTGRLTVQAAGGDQTKAAEGAIVAKMTAASNKTGVSTNGSVFAGNFDSTNSQFVGVRRKTDSGAKVGARFQIYRRDASDNGTAAFMQVDYTSTATVKSIFEFGHNYGTKEDNWGTMTFGDVTKNVAYKEDYDTALNDTSTSAPQTKAVNAAIESHTSDHSNPHEVTAEQVGAYTKERVDAEIKKESDARVLYDSQLRESIEALEEKAEEFVTGEEVSEAIAAEADSRIQEDIAINARIDMIPQTDWNETDEGSMAYLANHPTPISDIDIEALFS